MTYSESWTRSLIILVALVPMGSAGCASDASKVHGASDGGAGALRVATYNAGLLDSVGYVSERLPLVTEGLSNLDADVLCVQEFWREEHWDGLVAANESTRSNVLHLDPRPGVTGKCSPDEFLPLRSCAATRCSGAGPSDLVSCTTTECPAEVAALSGTCITCLLDNATSGDLDVIAAQCLGTANGGDAGAISPDERAYLVGGSFGIGLLSRFPFLETGHLELDSSTNRRAILYAKLDAPSLGDPSVFCTHLAPIEHGVKYEGSYGSWEGENHAHVKALIDWVDDEQGATGPVLVLGDLNTGPAGTAIAPSVPDDYALLPAAGFADPFLGGPSAACTFCVENPLVDPTDAAADADIDHILTRRVAAVPSVDRLFTDPVTVTVGGVGDGGAGDAGSGRERQIRRSDHYGLLATFGR
ncbi:MAG TPA: endonuclease/exonuclease/phosphatase family protein [Polyangiaceae bacterium]|nr:endonuclease/exonuclease/phosphatase family protein [Polyangiaceae bacterium]